MLLRWGISAGLICHWAGFRSDIRQSHIPNKHYIWFIEPKMAGYCQVLLLYMLMDRDKVKIHKLAEKNEANIQPYGCCSKNFSFGTQKVLVPRDCAPFGNKKESWPLGIKVQFSGHVKSNHSLFSGNQSECQTWLWACADWKEVCESQTPSVGPSQRSRLFKRSVASRNERERG